MILHSTPLNSIIPLSTEIQVVFILHIFAIINKPMANALYKNFGPYLFL